MRLRLNTNILKVKLANTYARNSIKSIKRKRKIRSSSVMSVNIHILKVIHRNHEEKTDVKLKTEET